MNGKLKNILPLAGLFCGSLVFSPVFADMDSDTETTTSYSQITPPAGFAAAQGIGFSIYADFIYWQARAANLDFVESNVDVGVAPVTSQGQVYYPSFSYMPGFKVGLAFDVGHDNWDINAEYTWLNGDGGKNSVSGSFTEPYLAATREIFVFQPSQIVHSDGNFGYHYNLVSLDLGRNYYISEYLTLRPYFGLGGAWDKTTSLVHYTFYDDAAGATGDYVSQNYKQNFWGVGFRTGLNTAWCFDENWSIYGDFGIMNLWSRFKTQAKETDYDIVDAVVDETSGVISYNTEGSQYGVQYVLDIQMGIRWGMRFNDDTMGFGLQLGWDQQVWINHVQEPVAASASNLSLQGLDFRARFDF
jgi:hypothetical protein